MTKKSHQNLCPSLFLCLSLFLFVCLSVSICLSLTPSLSLCLSLCLPLTLSFFLSFFLSFSLFLVFKKYDIWILINDMKKSHQPLSLSLSLSLYLFLSLFLSLSLSLSLCLCLSLSNLYISYFLGLYWYCVNWRRQITIFYLFDCLFPLSICSTFSLSLFLPFFLSLSNYENYVAPDFKSLFLPPF